MATFTALNGGSPKTTEGINGNSETRRSGSPGKTSGQEAGEPPTSRKERDSWAASNHDRIAHPSASYPDVEGSHKRKRSLSTDPKRDLRDSRSSPPDTSDPPGPRRQSSESRDTRNTPPQRDYRPYSDDVRDQDDPWYSARAREARNSSYDQQSSAGPNSAQSDEHIGEVLRRATSNLDTSEYGRMSPEGDDRSISMYQGQYSEHRRDGVIQSDPKKRKRNFSNRTKTGCLTCRRRKKKCDETKPECKLPAKRKKRRSSDRFFFLVFPFLSSPFCPVRDTERGLELQPTPTIQFRLREVFGKTKKKRSLVIDNLSRYQLHPWKLRLCWLSTTARSMAEGGE